MFKKLIFKTFVMLFLLFGLGSYGMYLTTGKTPFDMAAMLERVRSAVPQEFSGTTMAPPKVESEDGGTAVLNAGSIRVYKWQDAQGQWHYGEKPPEDDARVESMVINRDQNVIAGVRPPPEEPRPQALKSDEGPGGLSGSPYTPDNIKKMFEDARNLQKLMDARNQAQDALMNQ